MPSKKVLTVATEVQKAVLINVLVSEITSGFWRGARPADHADAWKGTEIVVGTELGATGFEMPRNYNFVNPDFFRKAEARLMEAAIAVDSNITVKQLKKQLISLNQILGSRLKEVGGAVTKLPRGRTQTPATEAKEASKSSTKTRKVAANIVEPEAVAQPETAEA